MNSNLDKVKEELTEEILKIEKENLANLSQLEDQQIVTKIIKLFEEVNKKNEIK